MERLLRFYFIDFFISLGEVIVQRLNLQVLWTQPAPSEDAKVCGIGWRPDERILAIGNEKLMHFYSSSIPSINTFHLREFLIHLNNILTILNVFVYPHSFPLSRLQQWKSDFGRCGKSSNSSHARIEK